MLKNIQEYLLGKLQALSVKMFDPNITYINISGHNNDDKAFLESLNKYSA